jgi:hypothetical protein
MAPVVPWDMGSIVRAISVQTDSRQKHKQVLSFSELEKQRAHPSAETDTFCPCFKTDCRDLSYPPAWDRGTIQTAGYLPLHNDQSRYTISL